MRSPSTAFANALAAGSVQLTYLVELDFDSGSLYLNTSAIPLTWNGHTWLAAGAMGKIEATTESAAGDVPGLRMELSGLSSSYVAIALAEHVQGRTVKLYLALFDSNNAIIVDPVLEWSGLIDQMSISDGGGTASIVLTAESRLIDFKRSRVKRYNSTDHQRDHPSDEFFSFVEAIQEKQIVWPSKKFWEK
jgi:hypothetical protein